MAKFLPLISMQFPGGSALVVGDVKQSIYRFRNGDCIIAFRYL